MFNFFINLYNTIQKNPTLSGAFGLSVAGIIGFWLKDVPGIIYGHIKREFTTELIITNQHCIFYDLLKWIEINYSHQKFRKFKLTNGRWGEDKCIIFSIGYGFHIIRYKKTFLGILYTKEGANQTEKDKESIIITKIGRNKKILENLVAEFKNLNKGDESTKVYVFDEYWRFYSKLKKRQLDSIFLEKSKKNLLLDKLNIFINKENWYIENGIPYQLGILLYGFPGCGKTSIIKALSYYLKYPIYYLPATSLTKLSDCLHSIPEKCLLVIEDLDCSYITKERKKEKVSGIDAAINEMQATSLSDVLNALDGIYAVHGRILIATTNHLEKLDGALIRPGRIDLKIEIGYVNKEILKQFIDFYFPNNTIHIDNLNIKKQLTPAELQEMILGNISLNQIIQHITIK